MKRICTVLSFVVLVATFAFGQQPTVASGGSKLTNQDIIGMVSLGLSDDVILRKISVSQNTDFDTSLDGLRALKAAKVSDAVIKQMIQPKAMTGAVLPATARPEAISGMPDLAPGASSAVYYKDLNGNWTSLNLIISAGQISRGFPSKGFAIYRGGEATVRISGHRPIFFVQSSAPINAGVWQILQLGKKNGQREIQVYQETMNGGKTGINGKDIRDVVVTKITNRVASVTPASDLADGEYIVTEGSIDFDFGIGK